MAELFKTFVSLSASGTQELKAQLSADLPPADTWKFVSLDDGVVTAKPYFTDPATGTEYETHDAYTIASGATVIVDESDVSDWLFTETGGANTAKIKITAKVTGM